MPILPVIAGVFTGLFGAVSTGLGGLFGFKGDQAKTVQEALKVLQSVNDVDGQTATATASALSAILTQGSFLERSWRPLFMLILMVVVVSFWFGYQPPNMNATMSPTMREVWDLLKIGLCGYMPLRTLEKVIREFNISGILKELIKKKVL